MRLLFVISSLGGGGAQRALFSVADSLSRFYLEDIYIASWMDDNIKFNISDRIHVIKWGHYNKTNNKILNYYLSIGDIRQSIKDLSPDYIIATQANVYLRVFLANAQLKKKLIVWEHTSMGRKLVKENMIARKYFYKYAHQILVLTNKDYEIVKKKYKRVSVMPNPLPFDFYNNESSREKTVIAIGRLDVWKIKGFDTILEIWSIIHDNHKDWKLKIAGDGTKENQNFINSLIRKFHVEESVELLGFRSDIQELLCSSQIFVLPSRVEGFPMSLVEAMSQGCACVSFSIQGAIEDIIQDKKDGIIVPDRNCELFAEELSNLMSNEGLISRYSNEARINVKRFEPKAIAEKWEKLLSFR